MKDSKLTVAVVGASGSIANSRHIPCLKRSNRAEIVAFVERSSAKAEAVAKRYRVPSYYTELGKLLENPPDVVVLSTPPWTHAPLAIQAMSHGCHVFTEKPMAMSTAEAAEVVAVTRENSVKLCVSHNFLFSRSMLKAQRIMESGELGEITYVHALQLSSPLRKLPKWYPQLPGGLFFDEAPHMMYLLEQWLPGMELEWAEAKRTDPGFTQEVERIEARFGGKRASGGLTMIFNSPVSEWLLGVFGTRRILVFDVFRDILVVMDSDRSHSALDILRSSASAVGQFIWGFISSGYLYTTKQLFWGHEVLIEAFLESIVNDTSPPVTPEDGERVVRLMIQILQACDVSIKPNSKLA